jgi:hypothetical protein
MDTKAMHKFLGLLDSWTPLHIIWLVTDPTDHLPLGSTLPRS